MAEHRGGCLFTVISEVTAAVLSAFFTCFRCFFTIFCEVTGKASEAGKKGGQNSHGGGRKSE
jgi:hypothetical protein